MYQEQPFRAREYSGHIRLGWDAEMVYYRDQAYDMCLGKKYIQVFLRRCVFLSPKAEAPRIPPLPREEVMMGAVPTDHGAGPGRATAGFIYWAWSDTGSTKRNSCHYSLSTLPQSEVGIVCPSIHHIFLPYPAPLAFIEPSPPPEKCQPIVSHKFGYGDCHRATGCLALGR